MENVPETNTPSGQRRKLSRRAFLLRCGAGLLGTGLVGGAYARYVEPFWPELARVPLDLPNLPSAFEGFRIIQLSDIHVAPILPMDYLRKQFDRSAALGADLIVLTGDYLTCGYEVRLDLVGELVARLRAKHGVLAILGNHDYFFYRPDLPPTQKRAGEIAAQVVATLRTGGVRVLRNELHTLEIGGARLQIVGLDDLWGGGYSPRRAFQDVNPDRPCIALSHNPDTMDQLQHCPCDWVLSGHTHGGQVRLPLFGPLILPNKRREYSAGLYEVGGKRLYVNRGLGYIRQVRFACRPEITEFTLTRRA